MKLLTLLISLLSANILSAQTLSVSIAPNTPFQISFDSPVDTSTSYRVWCDGNILKNYTATEINNGKSTVPNADGTFTFTISVPGLSLGKHSCLVSAFNDLGEAKSLPLDVPVGTIPSAPINLRFVVEIKK
jgi:hypothetical protein